MTDVVTIALVGDIHGYWQTDFEAKALQTLGVDLVLLVGDFGNEDVALTRSIASLDFPKAIILGNHDSWYTATPWGKKKSPYPPSEDRVQMQLDILGKTHVGYAVLDFPEFDISVVGARPFSWGGSDWKEGDFYARYYGVGSMAESSERISGAIDRAQCGRIIMIGHNGPYGLGAQPSDPCGKDWQIGGGDHGDPDFATALAYGYAQGKSIPLVAFGHMHHQLKCSPLPRRSIVWNAQATVFVNGAIVPRIISQDDAQRRCFTLIHLGQKQVEKVQVVWV